MTDYGLPVLFVVLVWWATTGLILLLDGLPRHTFRWSMLGASALAGAALYGIAASSAHTSVGAAYTAFACSIVVWGWQELSFLTGVVTGPRRHACTAGCTGTAHFLHAIEAILYHELAIAASAAAVVALTWEAPNQVGTWTFMVLWAMRQSAKLNLFLGVRNLGVEFLPGHLRYLACFFHRRPMNLLFPLSVSVPTIVLVLMVREGTGPGATPFDVAGTVLVATLLGLAILEHWFLVLPLPASALWGRGQRNVESLGQAGNTSPAPDQPQRATVEVIDYHRLDTRSLRG